MSQLLSVITDADLIEEWNRFSMFNLTAALTFSIKMVFPTPKQLKLSLPGCSPICLVSLHRTRRSKDISHFRNIQMQSTCWTLIAKHRLN